MVAVAAGGLQSCSIASPVTRLPARGIERGLVRLEDGLMRACPVSPISR